MIKTIHCGRWRVLAVAAMLAFAAALFCRGPDATFRVWGLNVESPAFSDSRVITAGIESLRDGHQPWVHNPRDPWQRNFNYPRVWLGLERLGIDQSHTTAFAVVLTVLFLTGVLVFPDAGTRPPESLAILMVVFSPAAMLGVRQGNIDQCMFFVLAMSVIGMASRRGWARALGLGGVLAGMALKIYPVFGAGPVCAWEKKRRSAAIVLIAAGAALYASTHWDEMRAIQQATPMADNTSYGRSVLWMRVSREYPAMGEVVKVLSWAGVVAGLVLIPLGLRAAAAGSAGDAPSRRALAAFQCGAGIYCGTFLLGNNWDYRLMFLAFAMPFLASLSRRGGNAAAWVSRVALVAVIVSCWHIAIWSLARIHPFGSPLSVALDEACNWLAYLGLMFLSGFSLRCVTGEPRALTAQ